MAAMNSRDILAAMAAQASGRPLPTRHEPETEYRVGGRAFETIEIAMDYAARCDLYEITVVVDGDVHSIHRTNR